MTQQEMVAYPFVQYQEAHRKRLQALVATPRWQALLTRRAALDQWRADTRPAPPAPAQLEANRYLQQRNIGLARELLARGERNEDRLLDVLGDWQAALGGADRFPISFLGIYATLECQFMPRCIYCNQLWAPRKLRLDDWKAILTEAADPAPPYVYVTGGEPLILGAEIWGDDGLVAFATRLGSAVNVNTNATLITPQVALQLVKVGLAKVHISLDSADAPTQDALFQWPGTNAVLNGLYNLQVAREVLGANHPQVHINCVLTARNMFQFPDLLRFLMSIRQVRSEGFQGKITDDPLFRDFAFHLIPVGGAENAFLRPTAGEWKRFYTETWAEADEVWREYQASVGVPEEDRRPLAGHVPFANPYLRADHGMDLDAYCERAGKGEYWQGALCDRCYVAPTQAFILPDGSQHWCGAHAIRRPPPLGNVLDAGLRENIRRNMAGLSQVPNAFCTGCAGATCVINQAARRNLRAAARKLLEEE